VTPSHDGTRGSIVGEIAVEIGFLMYGKLNMGKQFAGVG
jgi:hypothetical protein